MGSTSLNELFYQQASSLDNTEEVNEKVITLYFKYGTKNYCTSINSVSEIIDFPVYVPTPVDIGSTLGVFNLRGNIIPIMDPDGFFIGIQENAKFKAAQQFASMKLRLVIFELPDGIMVSLPVSNVGKIEISDCENGHGGHITINGLPHEKFDFQKFPVR